MRGVFLLGFCLMLACGASVMAADAPPAPPEQADAAQPGNQAGGTADSPQQAATEQAAEPDTEQEQPADDNNRFIPTEQISQDLGVSFPVDI